MANSDDRLRSFLCPKLWQWCQSDDEDENEDTNLLLQYSRLWPGIFKQADSGSDWYTMSGRFMNDGVTT